MEDGDKTDVGTTITLFLNEDCLEFCNEYKAREVVKKYCSFMPTEIYLSKANTKETQIIKEEEKLPDDEVLEEIEPEKREAAEGENAEAAEGTEEPKKLKIRKRPELINETQPLWTKHPNECTKEEYLDFYRKVFQDYKEPLFWIHLNMDYPFNLKGILYFPKINMEYDSLEGTIKLYNNQVFIADNIKEVIPEFLMLLKGVIDCPDLPLNVSRSALQNDGFVKKISDYITKKVADKLSGMCKTDRENYEKYWDDIAPFIKFGYIKDEKFAEKMGDYILYKNLEGKYLTLNDCLEENKEKHENTIFYVTNEKEQSQYINLFKEEGIDAVIMPAAIDNPFISHVEQKHEGLKFLRIDTDLNASFKEEVKEDVKYDQMNAVGFHIPGAFDKVLAIDKCWLQDDISNQIRNAIRDYAYEHNYSFFNLRSQEGMLRNLMIRTSSTGELMVLLQCKIVEEGELDLMKRLLTFVAERFPQITSLLYVVNNKCNDTINDLDVMVFKGNNHIFEEMEGLRFKIGAKSFYQTNSGQAYNLYKVARNFARLTGNELVYDLYTGTGTIANFVSRQAKKVIGIEYVPEAIEDAKVNSAINGIDNTLFYAGDMKDILTQEFISQHGRPDVIITDPPRAGMHDDVINTILFAEPQRIVYVSCNPATQARDLSLLDAKYKVMAVQPVDMFPHTHHVENVVLLEKRG